MRVIATPQKPSKNSGFEDRSSNWPVSSRVARHFRHPLPLVAILFLTACSGATPPPPAAATGAVRGGALTASLRSEPLTFNRIGPPPANSAAVDLLTRLTHAPLARV